jgi:hypothetical protein
VPPLKRFLSRFTQRLMLRHMRQHASIRSPHHHVTAHNREREATLMHHAMMVAIQQHEVIEARRAAVGPVLDVVRVYETRA